MYRYWCHRSKSFAFSNPEPPFLPPYNPAARRRRGCLLPIGLSTRSDPSTPTWQLAVSTRLLPVMGCPVTITLGISRPRGVVMPRDRAAAPRPRAPVPLISVRGATLPPISLLAIRNGPVTTYGTALQKDLNRLLSFARANLRDRNIPHPSVSLSISFFFEIPGCSNEDHDRKLDTHIYTSSSTTRTVSLQLRSPVCHSCTTRLVSLSCILGTSLYSIVTDRTLAVNDHRFFPYLSL